MKSRITIEVDFDNGNQPVIQILAKNSSTERDVRDDLVQSFLQAFQGSETAKIQFYITESEPGLMYNAMAKITPIKCEVVNPVEPHFFSRFGIGDGADYTTKQWREEAFRKAVIENPSAKEEDLQYVPRYSYGKIVAVKFTAGKVLYDIVDDFTGKVVKEIVSDNVKNLAPEFSVKQK